MKAIVLYFKYYSNKAVVRKEYFIKAKKKKERKYIKNFAKHKTSIILHWLQPHKSNIVSIYNPTVPHSSNIEQKRENTILYTYPVPCSLYSNSYRDFFPYTSQVSNTRQNQTLRYEKRFFFFLRNQIDITGMRNEIYFHRFLNSFY